MRKQDVFLVSGRRCRPGGNPYGDVINCVVCAPNAERARVVISQGMPDFAVLSVTPFVVLEDTVNKIKAVLAGTDQRWQVFLDPVMEIN